MGPAADGDHSVDGLDSGLQGFRNRFPGDDSRRFGFDDTALCSFHFSFAVDGLPQAVEHAPEHRVALVVQLHECTRALSSSFRILIVLFAIVDNVMPCGGV